MPKEPKIPAYPICEYDNVSMNYCSCRSCNQWQKSEGFPIVYRNWLSRLWKAIF